MKIEHNKQQQSPAAMKKKARRIASLQKSAATSASFSCLSGKNNPIVRVVEVQAPIRVTADASNFRHIVQRFTGNSPVLLEGSSAPWSDNLQNGQTGELAIPDSASSLSDHQKTVPDSAPWSDHWHGQTKLAIPGSASSLSAHLHGLQTVPESAPRSHRMHRQNTIPDSADSSLPDRLHRQIEPIAPDSAASSLSDRLHRQIEPIAPDSAASSLSDRLHRQIEPIAPDSAASSLSNHPHRQIKQTVPNSARSSSDHLHVPPSPSPSSSDSSSPLTLPDSCPLISIILDPDPGSGISDIFFANNIPQFHDHGPDLVPSNNPCLCSSAYHRPHSAKYSSPHSGAAPKCSPSSPLAPNFPFDHYELISYFVELNPDFVAI